METSTARVREVVGPPTVSDITDQAIQDALWEFYFDIPQTVQWLLGTSHGLCGWQSIILF